MADSIERLVEVWERFMPMFQRLTTALENISAQSKVMQETEDDNTDDSLKTVGGFMAEAQAVKKQFDKSAIGGIGKEMASLASSAINIASDSGVHTSSVTAPAEAARQEMNSAAFFGSKISESEMSQIAGQTWDRQITSMENQSQITNMVEEGFFGDFASQLGEWYTKAELNTTKKLRDEYKVNYQDKALQKGLGIDSFGR